MRESSVCWMYTSPFRLSGVTVVPFNDIFPARNSTRYLLEDPREPGTRLGKRAPEVVILKEYRGVLRPGVRLYGHRHRKPDPSRGVAAAPAPWDRGAGARAAHRPGCPGHWARLRPPAGPSPGSAAPSRNTRTPRHRSGSRAPRFKPGWAGGGPGASEHRLTPPLRGAASGFLAEPDQGALARLPRPTVEPMSGFSGHSGGVGIGET